MYKLLALGTLIGLGVGLFKVIKKKKVDDQPITPNPEVMPAQ